MNYYEHHLGDYLRDTAHLSMIEDGAYRRLIDAYYIAEQPFADDKRELMKLCRAVTKQERDAVEYVLRKFFVYEEGSGWLHRRCEREIARFKDKQRKAKASADARWAQCERNANASANASANAMRTHSERNADGMHRAPVPRHQTPDPIPSDPNGSAGKPAPPTDRDMVYANGVTLLTSAGVADRNARSFLAAQCKAHGEAAVRAALDRCASERPIEPVAWLQAALKSAAATPIAKPDRIAAHNAEVVRRFAARSAPQ